MLLEILAVGVACGLAGFILGRQSSATPEKLRGIDQRAVAYTELFSALSEAYSVVLNASVEEHLSEGVKQSMWGALNALSRTFDRSRFLFPEDLVTVMDEWIDAPFIRQGWDERLEALRHAKDSAYHIARKEFAGI